MGSFLMDVMMLTLMGTEVTMRDRAPMPMRAAPPSPKKLKSIAKRKAAKSARKKSRTR